MCMANPQLLMTLMNTNPRIPKVLEVIIGLSTADLASAATGPPPGRAPGGAPPEFHPRPQEPPKAPEPSKPSEPETPEQKTQMNTQVSTQIAVGEHYKVL